MILEFGIKNFFSFKEIADISFRLDGNCPHHISQGLDFSTALCIKGANGSGKTQLLKALSFLADFCTNSFASKPEQEIEVSAFFNNGQASEFYVDFKDAEASYRYELITTETAVQRETLYKNRKKFLERDTSRISTKAKALHALGHIALRKNASIIDIAHQYGLADLDPFYRFFRNIISNVGHTGISEQTASVDTISRLLSTYQPAFDFVKPFIMGCDLGIADIKIAKVINKNGKEEFFPQFIHQAEGKDHPVSDTMESAGTQRLFKDLLAYKTTLDAGGLLVIDEIDLNLHPRILAKLVGLFLNPATNPNHAQIIFSTHDSEILNILGRYRVYLVEKEENESFAYRLDEIPGDILRNDRPVRPPYVEGKIGGVPRI